MVALGGGGASYERGTSVPTDPPHPAPSYRVEGVEPLRETGASGVVVFFPLRILVHLVVYDYG